MGLLIAILLVGVGHPKTRYRALAALLVVSVIMAYPWILLIIFLFIFIFRK